MNEEQFTGKATVYAKHRPGYPEAYLQYLYSEVSLNAQSVIADIGSGTGILTKMLLDRGSTVFAVEPNADMRAAAEQILNARARPNFHSIPAAAESTTLPDNSMDAITVAQAFHWFDRQRFKTECQRILKPNAPVALVWNLRDPESPLVCENEALIHRHCPQFKGFSGRVNCADPQQFADFFYNGECDYRIFRHDLEFDEEGFIGRNLSGSYAPQAGAVEYAPFVAAIKKLFAAHSKNGVITLPNVTQSYVGKISRKDAKTQI